MSTSSENLIHFVIRCHRENILVLQFKPSITFHVECDVSSINRRRVPYHTRLKCIFDHLLYIIFFITQIHTVSINEEVSIVRPSEKKILKKSWKTIFGKKIWKKKFEKKFRNKNFGNKFEKKNLKKNYETKILEKKFEKKILKKKFETKILKKKMLEKKFWKKGLTKKFWKNELQNKNFRNQNL